MTTTPLLTSIPPVFRRFDKYGSDIGYSYLRACVTSWISNSFTPVSINTRLEIELNPHLIPTLDKMGIRSHVVDNDASAIAGKPLPYVQDFLDFGKCFCKDQGFVITNSDILLPTSLNSDFLSSLPTHIAFAYSQRVDGAWSSAGDTSHTMAGKLFNDGIDFFYFRKIPHLSTSLVFGLPWWDYFLPIAAIVSSLPTIKIIQSHPFHFHHDERWQPMTRNVMLSCMTSDLSRQSMKGNTRARAISEIVEVAKTRSKNVFSLSKLGIVAYLLHRIRMLTASYQEFVLACQLAEYSNQIANLCLKFIRLYSVSLVCRGQPSQN